MKTFRKYYEDTELRKPLTIAFGRFNPPHLGHEEVFKKIKEIAKGGDYRIYVSQKQNKTKDPLSYVDKVKFLKEMFPEYANEIIYNEDLSGIMDIATEAYDEGYNELTIVAGSDRIPQFKAFIPKYNDVKSKHGYYNFDKIDFELAGEEREGDATGVQSYSASKMRDAAAKDDFQAFISMLPIGFTYSQELFDAVKAGLELPSDEEVAAIRGF